MKIVFLNLYSGVNNRGAETFVHGLATRLGVKEKVVVVSGGQLNPQNVKVHPINNISIEQPQHNVKGFAKRLFLDKSSLSVLVFTLKAVNILFKEKPDWVVPVNGIWQVLTCKLLGWILGFKILITGHSGPGWDERWNLWLSPDVFVATTGPTGDWAKSVAPWVRVEVIPYGIDVKHFAKAQPIKLDLERPIVLCNAAAVPYKRIDLAIKAVAKMEKGSLLHLGDGPLIQEIRELGTKELGNKRFASLSVPYDQVPAYYASCDVVTLSSEPQENSPMVFLEAMAAGKMVVVTDTSRNRWILGKAGIFINPTNIPNYAKCLKEATKNVLNRQIQKEVTRFEWINIANSYYRVIK